MSHPTKMTQDDNNEQSKTQKHYKITITPIWPLGEDLMSIVVGRSLLPDVAGME